MRENHDNIKVFVEVKGGNVQAISATSKKVHVYLKDYDNIAVGDPDKFEEYPADKATPAQLRDTRQTAAAG